MICLWFHQHQVLWQLNKTIYGLRSSPHAWQKLSRNTAATWHEKTGQRSQRVPFNRVMRSSCATWMISWWTSCSGASNSIFSRDQRETSPLATQSTFSVETSPTMVITTRSAWQTATQQASSTKQTCTTANQHHHREQKQNRSGTSTRRWRTFSIPTRSRKTTVDDIHTTGHQLCNKKTGKITDGTNNSWHNSRHRWVRRQRLGRMRHNKKVNNRLRHQIQGATIHFGSRTQATIALSSAEAELYTINTRETEMNGSTQQQKGQHQDLFGWEEHGNTDWIIEEGEHIEFKHLFIQQLALNDFVRTLRINTTANPSDILTKCVATETLLRHLSPTLKRTDHIHKQQQFHQKLQNKHSNTSNGARVQYITCKYRHTSFCAMDLVVLQHGVNQHDPFTTLSSSHPSSPCRVDQHDWRRLWTWLS